MEFPTGFDMVPNVDPDSFFLKRFDCPAISVAILALELMDLDGITASIGKLDPLSQITKIFYCD